MVDGLYICVSFFLTARGESCLSSVPPPWLPLKVIFLLPQLGEKEMGRGRE